MITNEKFLRNMLEELLSETGMHSMYSRLCGQLTLEDLYTTDSVYIAVQHCESGFRGRKETFAFMQSPWVNARLLVQDVVKERFKPRYYREKTITELSYRRILDGINRYGEPGSVIVMTDFSNFFNSIDHGVMKRLLSGYIANPRVVDLFMKFCEGDACLSFRNEASQVPASFFPSMIDHEMKDHMGAKVYCRYMDDIFFLAKYEKTAEHYLDCIRSYAGGLRLTLKEEEITRIPWGTGFAFC